MREGQVAAPNCGNVITIFAENISAFIPLVVVVVLITFLRTTSTTGVDLTPSGR